MLATPNRATLAKPATGQGSTDLSGRAKAAALGTSAAAGGTARVETWISSHPRPPQPVPWQRPEGPLSLAKATGDSSTGETRMGGDAAATRAWLPDIPGWTRSHLPLSPEPTSALTQLGPPGVGTAAAAGPDKEKPFPSHPVCDAPAGNALPALEVTGGGRGTCQHRAGGGCRSQTEVDWDGLGTCQCGEGAGRK